MGIPTARVIEKLDQLLGQKDFPAVEKHLQYWLADAEQCGDRRGMLTILNEQIGFYRKQERMTEAIASADAALALAEELGLSDTAVMGTTLINAATAYKAFDCAETALPLYERALEIYENVLEAGDSRLGGLYNNMALTLGDLGRYADARRCYEKALSVMEKVPNGELEQAITYCNLADLTAAEIGTLEGEQVIFADLEKAMKLLDTEQLEHNAYYAFVCEKCAPCFGFHGLFLYEMELKQQAGEIYERT